MNSRNQGKKRRNRKLGGKFRAAAFEVQRRAGFETLEERMLLAADLGGVDLPVAEGESSVEFLPPTAQEGGVGYLSGSALGQTPIQVTEQYFKVHANQFGLDSEGIGEHRVVSQYVSQHTRVTHIVLQQQHNGLDVANALITINLNNDGSVLAASSSFVSGLNENPDPSGEIAISPRQAFTAAAQGMGLTLTDNIVVVSEMAAGQMDFQLTGGGVTDGRVSGNLVYLPTADGVALAWQMQFQSRDIPATNTAVVDAASGQLVYAFDNIRNASYTALELPTNDLDDGNMVTIVDPAQSPGSPFGWHDTNGEEGHEFTITRGNNTHVVIGDIQAGFNPINPSPDGGDDLVFDFPFDTTISALAPANSNSVATNAFYVINTVHDVLYNYGFDEAGGNFQATNYTGVPGAGDHVQVHVQDPQEGPVGPSPPGPNCNAFIAPTPDGLAPYMNLGYCVLGGVNPIQRDFGLSNDVIVHEYAHGLTERLVAGPALNNLPVPQFDAIHEGNSDYLALLFKMKDTFEPDTRVEIGPWIGLTPTPANRTNPGIRREGYSYDTSINPITFDQWNSNNSPKLLLGTTVPNDESHNAGEIWASTLYDMTWELIAKYGGSTGAENFDPSFMDIAFNPDLSQAVSKLSQSAAIQPGVGPSTIFSSTGPDSLDLTTGANNYALQLFVDGMKLAPPSASFKQMRDSIMAADIGLTGGVNLDVIWRAFARRGLGFSADSLDLGPLAVPPADPFNTAFDLPPTPADIAGNVFIDANENGIREINEAPLANVSLFVDLNDNGTRELLEPYTLSDENGDYNFVLYTGGEFKIHAEPVPDYLQTEPSVQQNPGGEPVDGSHEVFVVYGKSSAGVDFGFAPSEIELGIFGTKYEDINGNGVQEVALGELGVEGIYIYLDLDGDQRIDFGEPAAVTDSEGHYAINFSDAGDYTVREVQSPGWVTTEPAIGHHDITIISGLPVLGINFGNQAQDDYGDAPTPYPSLKEDNGAVHGILPGFGIGTPPDAEINAINTGSDALGDDGDNTDDEDGVTINVDVFGADQPIVKGLVANLDVTISNGGNSGGVLQAWIDYNADGDWNDAGEQILADQAVTEGLNALTITVPTTATVGATFARFRYGYERGIGPTGRALVGEVEDHRLLILDDKPIATDDFFPVDQDTNNNELDVLINDFPSSLGPLTIVAVSALDQGGSASISPDGTKIFYSPAPNFSTPPLETFTYTISDSASVDCTATPDRCDTGTVQVDVKTTFPNAIAIDDYVDPVDGADANPPTTTIDVLANDIVGANGPLVLVPSGTTQNTANGGTVTVDVLNNTILYTPAAGFYNLDSFTYTASDSQNNTTTANVSVQVSKPGGACSPDADLANCDNSINFIIETLDALENPVSSVDVGDEFLVKISVQDARDAADAAAGNGIFAGFMDVLYDAGIVQVKPSATPIVFSGSYPNFPQGDATVPGIVNELGALQAGFDPLGSNAVELARMTFVATASGNTTIQLDQADVSPEHDTLVHILNSQPSNDAVVDHKVINFGSTNLVVNATSGSSSAGEGERLDASGDGHVSPMDALQVINDLNTHGARPLEPGSEGETAAPNARYDVNGDDFISPSDVLAIITYLNNRSDGEGEAANLLSLLSAPAEVVTATPEQLALLVPDTETSTDSIDAQVQSSVVLPVTRSADVTIDATPRQASGHDVALSRWMLGDDDEQTVVEDDFECVLESLADDVAGQWS